MPNTSTPSSSPTNPVPCCGPDCCNGTKSPTPAPAPQDVREQVRAGYAAIAQAGSWSATKQPPASCCAPSSTGAGGCCGNTDLNPDQLAAAIGYSMADLATSPDDANLGLSCGNPTALASLKPGETVLDLGSGAGFDAFIAGPKVGAAGRVIGVDMTPEMLAKARRNTAAYTRQTGLDNVEFRLGEIENIPVPDASVDVVISNCVLNLSPDQERVWKDVARVLKPGGRVAISDLVLLRNLPPQLRTDVEALVGCVAGARLADDVLAMARSAGLSNVQLERKGGYVDAMTDAQDPLYRKIIAALPANHRIGDYVTSANITATR